MRNQPSFLSLHSARPFTDTHTSPLFSPSHTPGILAIFNLGIAVVASFYVDRIGRRTLFLWSTFGMTITWVFWTLCEGVYANTKKEGAGRAILVSSVQTIALSTRFLLFPDPQNSIFFSDPGLHLRLLLLLRYCLQSPLGRLYCVSRASSSFPSNGRRREGETES